MPDPQRKNWTDEERREAVEMLESICGDAVSAGLIRAMDENRQENNEASITFAFNARFGTDLDPAGIGRAYAQFKKVLAKDEAGSPPAASPGATSIRCAYPGCENQRAKRGKGFCGQHHKMWREGKVKDAGQYPAKDPAGDPPASRGKPTPPTSTPARRKRTVPPAGPIKKRPIRKPRKTAKKNGPLYILIEHQEHRDEGMADPVHRDFIKHRTNDLDKMQLALTPDEISALIDGSMAIYKLSKMERITTLKLALSK